MFSFEYTPGSDTENPPVLDVLVEDIDAVRVSCVRNSQALRDGVAIPRHRRDVVPATP